MKNDDRFELVWWDRTTFKAMGHHDLIGVTAAEVRSAFNLGPHEYPGDCLEVTSQHVQWVENKSGMWIDLNTNEYFVCVYTG